MEYTFIKAHKYLTTICQPKLGFIKTEIKANDRMIVKNNLKKGNIGRFFKNKYNLLFPIVMLLIKYTDGAIAEEAIRLIDRLSSDKNPFLLLASETHLPFSAPKKYFNLYNPNKIPIEPFRKRAESVGDLIIILANFKVM